MKLVALRQEHPGDASAIRAVNEQAFGRLEEANLVELLRGGGAVTLSLVAVVEQQIIGHILYSPVTVGEALFVAGLGPMAVRPQFQRAGIGGRLIIEGTRRLQESGCAFIVVLGHPGYYPRFGFVPASRYGLRCEWEVPGEAFMVLPLAPGKLPTSGGVVKYRPEFSSLA